MAFVSQGSQEAHKAQVNIFAYVQISIYPLDGSNDHIYFIGHAGTMPGTCYRHTTHRACCAM